MNTQTTCATSSPDIEISVYDLAMRMQQLEYSMDTSIGGPSASPSRLLVLAAAANPTHPLHHRAFAFSRLEGVLVALRVKQRALTPLRRQQAFFWRSMFYPTTITRSQLAELIAATPAHHDEAEHRAAVLMDALADAEGDMRAAQGHAMTVSGLEASRAATRGAACLAEAGWLQRRQDRYVARASVGSQPAERFDLVSWIASKRSPRQDRPRERA
jgi:hypothetical protein